MKNSGPFGLCKGMQVDELDDLEEISYCKYKITNVPKSHPEFEYYILQITPITGLSWIKAIGRNIKTDSHGYILINKFNEMESKLKQKYGMLERTDFLLGGSIWNEPQDYMNSLLANERVLMAQWTREYESSLNEDLESIGLIACAASNDEGYIVIEYSFNNIMQSENEINSIIDDAL